MTRGPYPRLPRRRSLRVPAVLAGYPGRLWATIALVFAALASRPARRGTRAGGVHFSVSEVVRLTLVSHAMTDAMAAGRFPTDEPLNSVGHRQVDASIELGIAERAYCGPEKRSRQTAELLGLQAAIDPGWPIWTAAGGVATCSVVCAWPTWRSG